MPTTHKLKTTFTFVIEMDHFVSWIRLIFQQCQFLLAKEIEKLVLANIPGTPRWPRLCSCNHPLLHCQRLWGRGNSYKNLFKKKLFFCGDPSGEHREARTQLLLYSPAKTHTTCCPNDQIPTTMLSYASFSVAFTVKYARSPSESVKSY